MPPHNYREYHQAWHAANRERELERMRTWYLANRERVAARGKARRAAKAEQIRAESAEWREANREHRAEYQRAWKEANQDHLKAYREANREAITEYSNRRRARMKGAPVVEKIDRAAIIARDKSRCHLCGKRVAKKDIHLDHLIPLSLGGEHSSRNLAVAHALCNSRKSANAANDQLRLVG